MNIILNTNELGYYPFLETKVSAFIIGLKGFCVNQKYVLSILKSLFMVAVSILKSVFACQYRYFGHLCSYSSILSLLLSRKSMSSRPFIRQCFL